MRSTRFLLIAILLSTAAAYAQQPEAQRPQRIRLASGVTQGMLVHKVEPVYPYAARRQGIQGNVVLAGVIGKDDHMSQLKAVPGEPMLADAAIDAGTHGV